MKTKMIAVALLATFIYACSASKSAAPMAEAKKVAMTPDQAEGKRLFEGSCAKCHKLYDPKDYTAEQWQPILKQMAMKARLADADRDKIFSYVTMN